MQQYFEIRMHNDLVSALFYAKYEDESLEMYADRLRGKWQQVAETLIRKNNLGLFGRCIDRGLIKTWNSRYGLSGQRVLYVS